MEIFFSTFKISFQIYTILMSSTILNTSNQKKQQKQLHYSGVKFQPQKNHSGRKTVNTVMYTTKKKKINQKWRTYWIHTSSYISKRHNDRSSVLQPLSGTRWILFLPIREEQTAWSMIAWRSCLCVQKSYFEDVVLYPSGQWNMYIVLISTISAIS